MIRVGYIAGEPNPSRAPHLDRLREIEDIDLTVIYAARTVHRRTWTLELHHDPVFLRGQSIPMEWLLHHDYPVTPGIWPLLERERFDCLVIGGWSLLATQLAIVWAKRRRVPYLLVSENHLREPRPFWIRALKRVVLPRIVGGAAGQLVTGSLAREHALHYGARPDTITIFPNTVDVDAFEQRAGELRMRRDEIRAELGIAPDEVVVLQVSRLFVLKGVDLLVAAVAAARRRTNAPLRLLHVGEGPQRAEVEAQAKRLGVAATWLGLREGERLLEAYVAADIFVLLSRRETWGIVVNEALACGLPVVASDAVGAAEDLVLPGGNGEMVRTGDVESAAAALGALADDPERRKRYGERSRELIRAWGYEPSVSSFAAAVRAAVARR